MPADAELELNALLRGGALDRAATRALEVYGPELYGFLIHYLGSESQAADVFAQTCEDLWRGLPKFGSQCSVRTWLYVLARNAATRLRRSPWNRGKKLTGDRHIDALVAHARSLTNPWQRTEVKNRWQELRDALDPDDRSLLVLRVDRDLPWEDIARVTMGSDAPDKAALTRETARLRKRFQHLKEDLRRRAEAAGLLHDGKP